MTQRVASLEAVISGNVSGLQAAGAQAKSILTGIAKEAQTSGRALGDYSNAASEMATMNKAAGLSSEYARKTVNAYTSSLISGLSTGRNWNNLLMDGARAAKLNTSQIYNMAEASKMWNTSQLASASASEILTRKAYELSGAVKTGKMTAQEAGVAWKSYVKEQERVISASTPFLERYSAMSGKVNDIANGILGGAAKFGAAAVATGYAVKKGYDFARVGAEIEYTGQKFDRLAKAAGSTGDVFIRELRTATRGTVSDFGLLKQGADLLQLGLARDTTEAVRLSSVMTALGMDTGELTLALANQSKRRLDQLGLSLTKFNEIESQLKKTGMSKEDAFREAFMQTAEQTVLTTGNRADSGLGNFLRLEAAGTNVIDAAKVKAAQSPLVSDAANILQAMNAVQRQEMAWNGNMLDVLFGSGSPLRQTKASDFSDLWKSLPTNVYQAPKIGQSATQSYTAMAFAAERGRLKGPGVGMEGATAAPIDYAALLSGGLEVTQMTAEFDAKAKALNATLTEEQTKLDLLGSTYKKNGAEYMAQADKVDAVKASIKELTAAHTESMDAMALGMLKNKGASEEMQVQFARASGLITEQAADQYGAQNKLAEAFMTGRISADTYAKGVAGLQNMMSALNGYSVNTYIDVWIRQHGSAKGVAPAISVGGSGTAGALASTGQGMATAWLNGSRWTGGPLGDVNIVGDSPGGGWTPYTEAIINGYVVDAKTSKKLKDAGLLDGANALSFGGGIESPWTVKGNKRPPSIPVLRRPSAARRPSTGDPRETSAAPSAVTATATSASVEPAAVVATAAMQISANTQENTNQNMQNNTQQTIQAQQQSGQEIVAKLDEVLQAINRLPNRNDAYATARIQQQMNI